MKEVDNLEKYVLEEMRHLKCENEELRTRITYLERENRLSFIVWDNQINLNAKYLIEIKDNRLTITKICGDENERN